MCFLNLQSMSHFQPGHCATDFHFRRKDKKQKGQYVGALLTPHHIPTIHVLKVRKNMGTHH